MIWHFLHVLYSSALTLWCISTSKNTKSHINNTKYKHLNIQNNQLEKIHPNNTSKPAFLCKVGGRQKISKRTQMALNAEIGFVLVSSRLIWFSYEPEQIQTKPDLTDMRAVDRMNHEPFNLSAGEWEDVSCHEWLAVVVWSSWQQVATLICGLNDAGWKVQEAKREDGGSNTHNLSFQLGMHWPKYLHSSTPTTKLLKGKSNSFHVDVQSMLMVTAVNWSNKFLS